MAVIMFLLCGLLLIAGNYVGSIGITLYIGFFCASFMLFKGKLSRMGVYAFIMPYFIMLGISVWNPVFPYYTGILLSLLTGELFSRLVFMLLRKTAGKALNYMVLPACFFVFDTAFQKMPGASFINMLPIWAPVSNDRLFLNVVMVLGSETALLLILLILSALARVAVNRPMTDRNRAKRATPEMNRVRQAMSDTNRANLIMAGGAGFPVFGAGILFITMFFSCYFIAEARNTGPITANTANVGIVQGSYSKNAEENPSDSSSDAASEMNMRWNYYKKLAEGLYKSDVIVFPETVLGIYDKTGEADAEWREAYVTAAKNLNSDIVVVVTEGNSQTKSKDERFVAALLVTREGIKGITRKRNLVPFTEAKKYSRGTEYEVYDTSYGRVGISICYDINTGTVEKLKANGAQLILAPFNDNGFGKVYHNIHSACQVVKAAECAVPIAVASEDGISQLISDTGRVYKSISIGEKEVARFNFQRGINQSVYLGFGVYIQWLLFFTAVFGILYAAFASAQNFNKKNDKTEIR